VVEPVLFIVPLKPQRRTARVPLRKTPATKIASGT